MSSRLFTGRGVSTAVNLGELSGFLLQALTGISAINAAQERGWRSPECAQTQHSPSGTAHGGPSAPLLEKDQVS